jgi:hypothetical protein
MGADDIPNSGIGLDKQIYIVASTGTDLSSGSANYATDCSVLSKFNGPGRRLLGWAHDFEHR